MTREDRGRHYGIYNVVRTMKICNETNRMKLGGEQKKKNGFVSRTLLVRK